MCNNVSQCFRRASSLDSLHPRNLPLRDGYILPIIPDVHHCPSFCISTPLPRKSAGFPSKLLLVPSIVATHMMATMGGSQRMMTAVSMAVTTTRVVGGSSHDPLHSLTTSPKPYFIDVHPTPDFHLQQRGLSQHTTQRARILRSGQAVHRSVMRASRCSSCRRTVVKADHRRCFVCNRARLSA